MCFGIKWSKQVTKLIERASTRANEYNCSNLIFDECGFVWWGEVCECMWLNHLRFDRMDFEYIEWILPMEILSSKWADYNMPFRSAPLEDINKFEKHARSGDDAWIHVKMYAICHPFYVADLFHMILSARHLDICMVFICYANNMRWIRTKILRKCKTFPFGHNSNRWNAFQFTTHKRILYVEHKNRCCYYCCWLLLLLKCV